MALTLNTLLFKNSHLKKLSCLLQHIEFKEARSLNTARFFIIKQ
jgi:hypothetical protein